MKLSDLRKYSPDQPRDDDGRWASAGGVAAGVAAGAAAGVAGASLAARRVRALAYAKAKGAVAQVRAVRAKNARREPRHAAAADSIERGLRSTRKKFLPTAIRSLSSQAGRAEAETRLHIAQNTRPIPSGMGDASLLSLFDDLDMAPSPASLPEAVVEVNMDPAGEQRLRARAQGLRAQIADLREHGRPPRTVNVTGSTQQPKIASFQRNITNRRNISWVDPLYAGPRDPVAQRASGRAYARHVVEEFARRSNAGPKSLGELEETLREMPRAQWRKYLKDTGIPLDNAVKSEKIGAFRQNVQNAPRTIAPHTRVLPGYPNRAGRKAIADSVREYVRQRRAAWIDAAVARVAQSRQAARVEARSALRGLALLRGKWKAAALIGAGLAGAGAGGVAAHFLTKPREKMGKLAKAADDQSPPDPDDAVYRAGARIEDNLADRIARTFGAWTRIAGERLMDRGAALRTTLLTGIDAALRPLDTAAGGGAKAPVPLLDRDGEPRQISMSLDTGSERVNQYARNYRLKLAGNMADEQIQTIQSVLQDATLNGQATDVTARLLRQTIGLTPVQAGHVISYRRALTALDPNALNRALRDARYDRTVRRAIDTDTPLTNDQVNGMVDAYQRRYLAFRAVTIARTEGLRAANNGHVEAVKSYLDQHPEFTVIKTWMATKDDRTRDDHRGMDGQQVIGLYTPFIAPSGDRVQWPHDENAPLRSVVRCRCTVGFWLVPRTAVAHGGFSLVADQPS